MYQINKDSNNITKLEQKLFSELGFKEREHLQEWIAKNPDVLGEELLIIQKEFDGFNDTNERLDLLALDKDANLVIIENKLDDTGRDVTWQALKYTSYCSTLTTPQIIKIFQSFLDMTTQEEDAKNIILEFLEIENDEDLLLNKDDQRIIFVANNYRKEVTSTVVWLLNHDIQVQCFKATPYSLGDELFLQIDQIIPVPELEEFMIDAKEKQKEEKKKGAIAIETDKYLLAFWKQFKADLIEHNIHYLDNVTPKSTFYMGFWKGQGRFGTVIGRHSPRVELLFMHDENKQLIDSMYTYKDELDRSFDGKITWERLDNKKSSRIKYEMTSEEREQLKRFVEQDNDTEERITWYRESLVKFYKAVYPVWEKVQKELK